ncbi:hypothetical protein EON63_15665 [archaeon]|nr:MAG: hypothetical protein EON63_15665 [archaeon]
MCILRCNIRTHLHTHTHALFSKSSDSFWVDRRHPSGPCPSCTVATSRSVSASSTSPWTSSSSLAGMCMCMGVSLGRSFYG